MSIKNMFKNIFAQIVLLWKQDVSGQTLSEYSSFPAFSKSHPIIAGVLNYGMAILRLILYWIGTGIIGLVAPILGITEIIIHWSSLISGTTGIVGIVLFGVLVILLEGFWVIPYFISKAKGTYKDN